jgi:copper homeostasis protein
MNIIKENCLETQIEFNLAFKNHANQYEICSRLDAGGYTPDIDLVKYALSKTKNILVMIRNRFDYQVNEQDVNQLLEDIDSFKGLPIQGYVIGHLTEDNLIDMETTRKLVAACKGKETVFNMAFDSVLD